MTSGLLDTSCWDDDADVAYTVPYSYEYEYVASACGYEYRYLLYFGPDTGYPRICRQYKAFLRLSMVTTFDCILLSTSTRVALREDSRINAAIMQLCSYRHAATSIS